MILPSETETQSHISSSVIYIVLAALSTSIGVAGASLLGQRRSRFGMGMCIATAAGMMSGCSLVLFVESMLQSSGFLSVIGVCVGLALMRLIDNHSHLFVEVDSLEFAGLKGDKAVGLVVLVISMTVHSIGEGISLGLSVAHPSRVGSLVYSSIAVHNIPEGAALCLAFLSKGVPLRKAALLAVLVNLPQCFIAVPSFAVFSEYHLALPVGMGIAAGCMAYAVVAEMLPEATHVLGSKSRAVACTALATISVVGIDAFAHFTS